MDGVGGVPTDRGGARATRGLEEWRHATVEGVRRRQKRSSAIQQLRASTVSHNSKLYSELL